MAIRQKQKKLIPDTHVLMAFRHKGLPAADAISELIDNALGKAGATWFKFEFGRDCVVAIDNGSGVPDLDMLFGLGYSRSRYDDADIGNFGIGSKDAQMHFGDHCRVQSVCDGRYYDHSIDWAKIERSGQWPNAFDGESRTANVAPKIIRSGGTIITISELASRPRINIEVTIKRLTHRYRPALLKGKEISIIDARRGERVIYELASSLNALGLRASTTVSGEVEGRKFELRYGRLNEYDALLNGVHFGFDNRFIEQTHELVGTGVPSSLYAEVMLSSDWKQCFSPNKTKIIRHRAELQTKVLSLLDDWIKKLSTQAEQLKIEHVNLALKSEFNNVIVLDRNRKGDFVSSGDMTTSGGRGGGGGGGGLRQDEETVKRGPAGESHGTKVKRNRPCGVSFRRNDEMGLHTASSHELTDNNSLIIDLNGAIPAIAVAYEPPYKPIALWPIIAREFAKFCQQNVTKLDELVPGFLDALNERGYQVSVEYPEELADKVFAYVMKQVPLSARERGILKRCERAEDEEANAA